MPDQQNPRDGVVADVMSDEVLCVPAVATVTEMAELMRDHHVADVFVVEDGQLRGAVSERDLVERVVAADLDPITVRAARLCADTPVVLPPWAPVAQAAEMMRERSVLRSPVVDDQGRPVGTVTIGDLAAFQPAAPLPPMAGVTPHR